MLFAGQEELHLDMFTTSPVVLDLLGICQAMHNCVHVTEEGSAIIFMFWTLRDGDLNPIVDSYNTNYSALQMVTKLGGP